MGPEITAENLVAQWTKDYLSTYIRQGGASVKVVAGSEFARLALNERLFRTASEQDFSSCLVNAASTPVHTLYQLYNAIASQLNWKVLAGQFITKCCSELGYEVAPSRALSVDTIAEQNGLDPQLVGLTLLQLFSEKIFRRVGMSGEFKRAMFGLTGGVLYPSGVQATNSDDIELWLRGGLDHITRIKPCRIYRKISRQTARNILVSTSRWIRDCGHAGLVAIVDVSVYVTGEHFRLADGAVKSYSKSAAQDVLDVIRQFIDATDELEGLLLVFHADSAFLTNPQRGLESHQALRMRLTDEVYDSRRPNPLSPMVRLALSE